MGFTLVPTADSLASLSSSSASASASANLIYDDAQLPCRPPRTPDLCDLNNSLDALAVVFPDVQIEVFRELLANFDGESRLALVADALLKNGVAWVKGRWRVSDKSGKAVAVAVPPSDAFRRPGYKAAVQTLALGEFRGLSKSTIRAVLAENNYSYLDARRTLLAISSKSWRYALSAWILWRRPVTTDEAERHPLVLWRGEKPAIRPTGDAELDRELYDGLIMPIVTRARARIAAADAELARKLNAEEAEKNDAEHECACCFMSGPFEDFTQCNAEGHMLCFRCVRCSIKEAVFGQGWLSSINSETGTLRCLAVDGDDCDGCVSAALIQRAMMEEPKGDEIIRKLDQRLAEHSLLASKLLLVRCPFCGYAEIDDIYTPAHEPPLRIKIDGLSSLFCLTLALGIVPFLLPVLLVSSLICLFVTTTTSLSVTLPLEWNAAITRHRRRRRGLRFACQNTQCQRASCLSCSKAWKDVHVCHESSLVALRTAVEQAMSLAIKRVCPRCNTSFVKNAGCNKLTCPCGYKMCYVCRADLTEEGYRHYCDHFRPQGDGRACKECDRCNLWETEDTDRVLKAAREEAERKWKAEEKRDLSGADRIFLETGVAVMGRKPAFQRRRPTLPEVMDILVERLIA